MRKLLVLSIVLLAVMGGGVATDTAHAIDVQKDKGNSWIQVWQIRDQSIWPSIRVAAQIFHVSESTMRNIVNGEGGNVDPITLHLSLCKGYGKGWNGWGSSAFGPFQYMLDYKGACDKQTAWGTFGSYDDAAFQEAKRRGVSIPYRFKSPASNVGQAITAAYMLLTVGIGPWCASQC